MHLLKIKPILTKITNPIIANLTNDAKRNEVLMHNLFFLEYIDAYKTIVEKFYDTSFILVHVRGPIHS